MKLSNRTSPRAAPQVDRLSDSVAIVLGMTVVQRLVGLARSILFCIWLSAEELGEWDMAFGFLTLAVPVAVLSLPGCFGRYVAYYRQRGQLRTFLRRTLTATVLLASVAAVVLAACPEAFSRFIFGRSDRADSLSAVAFTLLSVIAFNIVNELLVALRLQRLASGLELLSTLLFAGVSGVLVAGYGYGALGVIVGYGAGCLAAALASLWWTVPLWQSLPRTQHFPTGEPLAVWSKVVPFAAALWLSNGLANLFSMADRYILVHHSGLAAADSLALTGEYHSSRLLPMLLMNVSGLLATVSLPFLSHEWESGPRANVSRQLNLLLKLTGIGLVAAAATIWLFSPLFFGTLLRGKFQVAPAILSLTLAYACLSGMVCLAKSYLWCAEKAVLVSVAYGAALAVNVGANLLLAPRFGVYGIANGTCLAHVVLLLLIFALARSQGFSISRGTWLISSLPLLLCVGAGWALAGVSLVCLLAARTEIIFDHAEKREMLTTLSRYRALLTSRVSRGPSSFDGCRSGGWGRSSPRWMTPLRRGGAGQRCPGGLGTGASPHKRLHAGFNAVCGSAPATTTAPSNAAEPPTSRPLRLMFVNTSLFVGGAESLEIELVRGFDRDRILPEICCLKDAGPMAAHVPGGIPLFHGLLRHKYDFGVVARLVRLFRCRQIDVVVTVGAGDRMFWGRLAAWLAGVPVIAGWLHSTGWPDNLGTLNRLLTPITDAFIAVAPAHRRYLVEQERLPDDRVYLVTNGVDTDRFSPRPADSHLRCDLGLPAAAPIGGIVARLSAEKNHELFLQVAALVREEVGDAQFLIVGDGPQRKRLMALADELGLAEAVHFVGNRADVPDLLALMDVFLLTSHIEANPVSILEAQAMSRPVVATRVGSVPDTVHDGEVGYLIEPGDARTMAERVVELFRDPRLARRLGGEARRQAVEHHSMRRMLERFQELLEQLTVAKVNASLRAPAPAAESSLVMATDSFSNGD